ncbi:MAG: 4-hydroxy-tetrahydrodipicolinate reductase [Oscillospiraceae bacterium]|jgi:4-hydroxy-tetrahydrodipicolinate reductase|nr:4-hydroxy-tetrahydrodipicolinate reductase [Oscillospiraceae bacterium]
MLNLVISGCNGYMGRTVAAIAGGDPEIDVVAGFDIETQGTGGFPVFANPAEFSGAADVVVDFSSPAALDSLLAFGLSRKIPLVLCTTGYDRKQLESIEKTAGQVPVFRSGNMSLGINLLADLVRRACAVLGGAFDVEIVERHHRRKVDAPSGTALLLADAAASALPYSPEYVFERQNIRQPRGAQEIGISSVRGGTIVGEHEVIFAGLDEVVELKHTAASRDVFAAGAIRAAKYIFGVKKPGMYDMNNVIGEI